MSSLNKALLLTVASSGLLTLSAAMATSASAEPYVSGSTTITNVDGSTYSTAGEIGGITTTSAVITPTYASSNSADTRDKVSALNLNATGSTAAAPKSALENQVVNTLTTLSNNAAFSNNALGTYLSIMKAAVGANGLD